MEGAEAFYLHTKLWKSLAEQFAIREELENIIQKKSTLAEGMFQYLEPISLQFLDIVLGKAQSHYSPSVSQAMCINRILKSKRLEELPSEVSEIISSRLRETFYLGMLTQLYLMNFPSRDQFRHVDLVGLEHKWEIDAVTADRVMGYYGDQRNPICMNIWTCHFDEQVQPLLRQHLKIGSFGIGKFRSFFRNLYIAGALLVMDCDLATQQTQE
jgi:hypothetical protein